jgi:hypothetical protein
MGFKTFMQTYKYVYVAIVTPLGHYLFIMTHHFKISKERNMIGIGHTTN